MTAPVWRGRLRFALDASRRAVRHPAAMIRIAAGLERRSGRLVARGLRTSAPEVARDAAFRLLVDEGLEQIVFHRGGLRWRVDIGDDIGRCLFADGTYEGTEIAAMLAWLRRSGRRGTVIDLGANVGTTTIPFALAGYSVVAVEPIPATFEMLIENVRANGLESRVRCRRFAIAEEPGVAEMWTGEGSGQAEVVVEGQVPAMQRWYGRGVRIEVPARPLRDLATRDVSLDDVALVWSDVQGAETAVIRSGTEFWQAGVPLYLEVDPMSLDLHAGLRTHLAAVEANFGGFITSDDLLAGGSPRPIAAYADWVSTIGTLGYSDALLIGADHEGG
jgi:FkbM family methyltransferase